MTDTSKREELIRAVQAMTWNASNYPPKIQPHILGQDIVPLTMKIVDAVEAVFEQAHTPTEHECTWACWVDRYGQDHHAPTDDERAVINDGTDDAWQVIADALGNLGYDLNSHEETAAWVQQYLFRRTVQGEPQVMLRHADGSLKSNDEIRAEAAAIRDHVRALTGETDAGLSELGGFQGEPTDSQVLAALNARELSVRERSGSARHFNPAPDLSYYSEGNVADMRAALRAAFQEGENR